MLTPEDASPTAGAIDSYAPTGELTRPPSLGKFVIRGGFTTGLISYGECGR